MARAQRLIRLVQRLIPICQWQQQQIGIHEIVLLLVQPLQRLIRIRQIVKKWQKIPHGVNLPKQRL
jgi:hypothetical protein